jgi:hypothetical protein
VLAKPPPWLKGVVLATLLKKIKNVKEEEKQWRNKLTKIFILTIPQLK